MRNPTQLSARLTSKLSWAQLLAAETSFRAKSVRFFERYICTRKATASTVACQHNQSNTRYQQTSTKLTVTLVIG